MRLNQLYINACFDNDNKEEMPHLGLQPVSLSLSEGTLRAQPTLV